MVAFVKVVRNSRQKYSSRLLYPTIIIWMIALLFARFVDEIIVCNNMDVFPRIFFCRQKYSSRLLYLTTIIWKIILLFAQFLHEEFENVSRRFDPKALELFLICVINLLRAKSTYNKFFRFTPILENQARWEFPFSLRFDLPFRPY